MSGVRGSLNADPQRRLWDNAPAVMKSAKSFASSAERNRDAILSVLVEILPPTGIVLEIASGTGQHAVHFASAFPELRWQPSDRDAQARASIEAWRQSEGPQNMASPIALDVCHDPWPIDTAEAVVCINMIHISPWESTLGLFQGAASRLATGAPLFLYGAYRIDGQHTAPSNVDFDAWLKAKDARFGVRDLEEVKRVGEQSGFRLNEVRPMPANNFGVIFERV